MLRTCVIKTSQGKDVSITTHQDEEFHNAKECREVYFNLWGIFNAYAKNVADKRKEIVISKYIILNYTFAASKFV